MIRINTNRVLSGILDIISPSECGVCAKGRVVFPLPVCNTCLSEILYSLSPDPFSSPALHKTYSCLWYTPGVKCCVKSFKFNGNRGLAGIFKKIIRSHILSYGLRNEKYDIVMPVPLHPSRKRKRGYNQSEILSDIASSFLSVPSQSNVLIKIRNTPPQSGLGKKQRKENLKNSFKVADMRLIKNRSVLLVDDVTTTGATLEECAATLIASGAASVSAFTLARAGLPLSGS